MRGNQKNANFVFQWSRESAYAVGLITTDGCLSKDGRHIDFTSKDTQLLETFRKCLKVDIKITYKQSGFSRKKCPRVQFSNVKLYNFLISIGLTPCKSKTLGELAIPEKVFYDFLRGHLDGDGYFYFFGIKDGNIA